LREAGSVLITKGRHSDKGKRGILLTNVIMLLLNKLTYFIYNLWKSNPSLYPLKKEQEVKLIQSQLIKSMYKFGPMLRTWIPKTKKPGEFRPITQPNKRDRLVLDGMTSILIESLEPSFLDQSHGFRRGKGSEGLSLDEFITYLRKRVNLLKYRRQNDR
jgi:hypothetical protein